MIRISIPALTEERRKELVKVAKKMAEECRVALRSIRRDINDQIKGREKKKEISEDDMHRSQEVIQEMIGTFTGEVEKIIVKKEKEILEV